MTDWQTRAMRGQRDDRFHSGFRVEDTVTVEEAEAKLGAAEYEALSNLWWAEAAENGIAVLEAKLAAAARYPHCDSEPDGLCLLEKAEARIASLEAELAKERAATDGLEAAIEELKAERGALKAELRRLRATIKEVMQDGGLPGHSLRGSDME